MQRRRKDDMGKRTQKFYPSDRLRMWWNKKQTEDKSDKWKSEHRQGGCSPIHFDMSDVCVLI
jgi:hypothetical protein